MGGTRSTHEEMRSCWIILKAKKSLGRREYILSIEIYDNRIGCEGAERIKLLNIRCNFRHF
jgi:hypothetical protein